MLHALPFNKDENKINYYIGWPKNLATSFVPTPLGHYLNNPTTLVFRFMFVFGP